MEKQKKKLQKMKSKINTDPKFYCFLVIEWNKQVYAFTRHLSKECGNSITAITSASLKKKGSYCSQCNHSCKSKGETKFMELLQKTNVAFLREYRIFRDLTKSSTPFFRIDFVVFNKKNQPIALIEIDGNHHTKGDKGSRHSSERVWDRDDYMQIFSILTDLPLYRVSNTDYDGMEMIIADLKKNQKSLQLGELSEESLIEINQRIYDIAQENAKLMQPLISLMNQGIKSEEIINKIMVQKKNPNLTPESIVKRIRDSYLMEYRIILSVFLPILRSKS